MLIIAVKCTLLSTPNSNGFNSLHQRHPVYLDHGKPAPTQSQCDRICKPGAELSSSEKTQKHHDWCSLE